VPLRTPGYQRSIAFDVRGEEKSSVEARAPFAKNTGAVCFCSGGELTVGHLDQPRFGAELIDKPSITAGLCRLHLRRRAATVGGRRRCPRYADSKNLAVFVGPRSNRWAAPRCVGPGGEPATTAFAGPRIRSGGSARFHSVKPGWPISMYLIPDSARGG